MGQTYTAQEVADRLGVKKSWIMRHLHELPHQRPGRHIRFTERHVAEIEAAIERRPTTGSGDAGLSQLSRTRLQRRADA